LLIINALDDGPVKFHFDLSSFFVLYIPVLAKHVLVIPQNYLLFSWQ